MALGGVCVGKHRGGCYGVVFVGVVKALGVQSGLIWALVSSLGGKGMWRGVGDLGLWRWGCGEGVVGMGLGFCGTWGHHCDSRTSSSS